MFKIRCKKVKVRSCIARYQIRTCSFTPLILHISVMPYHLFYHNYVIVIITLLSLFINVNKYTNIISLIQNIRQQYIKYSYTCNGISSVLS